MEEEEAVIVGAGIAGLATAVALHKVGVRSLVLERADYLRCQGATLTLFPNAWHSLDSLALSHKLTPLYPPPYKQYITNIDTGTVDNVSLAGCGLRVVHRKALLRALADELPNGTIRFSSYPTAIITQPHHHHQASSLPIIHLSNGTTIKTKAFIGCDGLHSVVAQRLGLPEPVNSGRWAIRGLSIFPGGHGLNPEFLQFVTSGKTAGFVPVNHKVLYWFLFRNHKPNIPKTKDKENKCRCLNTKLIQTEVIQNLAKDFPPIFATIVQHSDLSTLTCVPLTYRYPWDIIFRNLCRENIAIAGDATPDLGQNEGVALEDAVVLGNHIGNLMIRNKAVVSSEEIGKALARYAEERKWRSAGLIIMSYVSGMEKQSVVGWLMKSLVSVLLARFDVLHYTCGRLPCAREDETSKD